MRRHDAILAFTAGLMGSAACAHAQAVSTEWDTLPRAVQTCMQMQLQARGRSISTMVTGQVRPSAPQLAELMNICTLTTSATGDPIVVDFADWFNNRVLNKPIFSKAFNQCREIVGLYQTKVLQRLASAESAATSKSDQNKVRMVITDLTPRKWSGATVACLKQFIASLRVAGSGSGYYVDELASLEGKLRGSQFDLKALAAAKLDDMTDAGLARLAVMTGLEHLKANDLQAEIDAVGRGLSVGYLACLLPGDWVNASLDGFSPCHGTTVERKLTSISAALR